MVKGMHTVNKSIVKLHTSYPPLLTPLLTYPSVSLLLFLPLPPITHPLTHSLQASPLIPSPSPPSLQTSPLPHPHLAQGLPLHYSFGWSFRIHTSDEFPFTETVEWQTYCIERKN